MRNVLRMACIIACNTVAHAQQLAWEPSPRQPFVSPSKFVAVELSVGLAMHNARLPYLEDLYQIPCCTYEEGVSMPVTGLMSFESWILPTVALQGCIGIRTETASFSTTPTSLPRVLQPDVQTQYQMQCQSSWLILGVGGKHRLMKTPLTISGSISGLMLMHSSMTHREVILGPDDYFFVTDPPSKEYELPTASLSDVRGFVVRPALAVTYDVPLSAGYYVSPSLKLETIIGSLSQKHSWSSYGVSLGVSLARGL